MRVALGPLVGRESEILTIGKALNTWRRDAPAILCINGEAGIGKTSLLDRTSELIERAGARVSFATGSLGERDYPFGLITDLCETLLPADVLARRLEPALLASLGQVAPKLRPAGWTSDPSGVDLLLLGRALRTALSLRPQPSAGLAFVVDDLQWCDPASGFLIDYLVRRPPEGGGAFLVACTERSRPGVPLHFSDPIFRRADLTTVTLDPLSEQALGSLTTDLPKETRAAVYQASGGNPFYFTELVNQARRGPSTTDAKAAVELPGTVVAAVMSEINLTSDGARRYLDAAAVLGEPFDASLAGELSGITSNLAETIDELERYGLIRTDRHLPNRFWLRHSLFREIVYSQIPTGRKLELHQQAATLLRQHGAEPVQIAAQLEIAAPPGDAAAAGELATAAFIARPTNPTTAARLLKSALRISPHEGPIFDMRDQLLFLRSDCLVRVGQFDEAEDELRTALTTETRPEAVARLMLALARTVVWTMGDDNVRPLLESALVQLPPGPSIERTGLELISALADSESGRADSMRAHEQNMWDSLPADETPGLSGLRFVLTAFSTMLELRLGSLSAALERIEEADRLLTTMPPSERAFTIDGLLPFVQGIAQTGALTTAIDHTELTLEIAGKYGPPQAETMLLLILETSLTASGDLRRSVATLNDAEQLAHSVNSKDFLAYIYGRRALIAAYAGKPLEALDAIAAYDRFDSLHPGNLVHNRGLLATAEVLMILDRKDEANERLSRFSDLFEIYRSAIENSQSLELLARFYATQGKLTEAREFVVATDDIVVAHPVPAVLSAAARAAGAVAVADGRFQAAADDLKTAVARAQETGDVICELQSRLILADALAGAEDRDSAIAELSKVQTVASELELNFFRSQARTRLRTLGADDLAQNKRGPTGTRVLSEREREIAELALQGLSNREIGERLFLSRRTVDAHLRKVFSKLGIRSRVQLAQALSNGR